MCGKERGVVLTTCCENRLSPGPLAVSRRKWLCFRFQKYFVCSYGINGQIHVLAISSLKAYPFKAQSYQNRRTKKCSFSQWNNEPSCCTQNIDLRCLWLECRRTSVFAIVTCLQYRSYILTVIFSKQSTSSYKDRHRLRDNVMTVFLSYPNDAC